VKVAIAGAKVSIAGAKVSIADVKVSIAEVKVSYCRRERENSSSSWLIQSAAARDDLCDLACEARRAVIQ